MASQLNGGINVPGNLNVFGDGDINGDLNVDGVVTFASVGDLNSTTRLKLTPTAAPPSPAAEGMLYADTDHKLYYHNGTDWQEISFV